IRSQPFRYRLVVFIAHPREQRWILDDVPFAVALSGEARKRTVTGARTGTLGGALDLITKRLLGGRLMQPADIEAVVAAHQQRLGGEEPPLTAISPHTRQDRCPTLVLRRTVLPSGYPDAGRQPAQIPFPAARMGFIEVVQVDDQPPLG